MSKQLAITNGGVHKVGKKAYLSVGGVHRKAKRAYLTVKRQLPSGYTRREYIESSGTQYIDTGFKPNGNTRVVCDFQLTKAFDSSRAVFGARTSNTSLLYVLYHIGSNSFRTDYYGNYQSISVTNELARMTVDKNKNVTTLDGNTLTYTAATTQTTCNMFLFATNNAGSVASQAYVKIYSCQIYDNGTLIRDFVPCTNADGEAGLYDFVTLAFYGNAGTGAFTAGDAVADGDLVHRLCYEAGVDIASLGISYTGNMIDNGVVTMSGVQYRLLTLTSSGTLTVDEEVSAEVWMCGGGTSGCKVSGNVNGAGGGAGAFVASGQIALSGSIVASIGAGGSTRSSTATPYYTTGGETSFGTLKTSTAFGAPSLPNYGVSGGTGGGVAGGGSTKGTGDGISKYPFSDSSYFSNPHCGGGGAGGFAQTGSYPVFYTGGAGGTNGGSGSTGSKVASAAGATGGSGGNYGGGAGGNVTETAAYDGNAATYYGGGGGGGGHNYTKGQVGNGGAGYQGVIYIRIPVEQAA